MLRDRYDPINLFDLVPTLSLMMDPVLTQLDTFLDDDRVFQMVKADLAQRFPHTPTTGRPSTPAEVILRMLIVKHLYGWSYEQTEQFVADSLVLRQFCRVYAERTPDDTTLIRWANMIQPATLHRLLDHVVVLAQSPKVTRGRKLRLDGTVVETHIHHPTDSTLLNDGVRVLGRTLRNAREVVKETTTLARHVFRNRTRSAKRHRWFGWARHRLRHGNPDGVLADLAEALDVENVPDSARETLMTVYAYLDRHRDHIDYEAYKALGWPLGSGMVESACKWLIQQRFKGVGMRWSEAGFNHLLHLRLAWVNGSFKALFGVQLQPSPNT